MARITRSRQDPALKVEVKTTRSSATSNTVAQKNTKEKGSKLKANTKKALVQDENTEPTTKGKNNNVKTSKKKALIQDENAVPNTKGKNGNTKSSIKKAIIQDENAIPNIKGKNGNIKSSIKKAIVQDENAVPIVNKNKANVKTTQSKISVLGSKIHLTRKNNSSARRNSILALKSPVLRDRTNTSNEHIRSNTSAQKDVQLDENKKITKTNALKKSSKKYNDKIENELQLSIKKYVVKQPAVQEKESKEENSTKNKDKLSNCNKNENIQDHVGSTNSSESNAAKSRTRSNLSMEAIEELVNQKDEISETKDKELNKDKSKEENIPMELDDNEKEEKKTSKKFFKHKIEMNIVMPSINRKNPKRPAANRKKVATAKKVINNDNTFHPNIKEQRKSIKSTQKQLRTRAVKNYCEVSKDFQDSKSEKKQSNKITPATESDKKGVPIYKTIECSQENENKKETYEFPDDSQESEHKVRKQKRIIKKPTVKRARKAAALPATSQKTKSKPSEKIQRNVQFKEKEKQQIMEPKQNVKKSAYANIEIPENLQNAGDSTIAEASTIKILSDKILEDNERINLMVTPSAPKTINSELKLFGPTNAITSQPKIQYSNMVNHSLIRQSMSPIRKEIDNFDIGSPWRPIDAFSRVKKVVQSTPQINRVLAGREKKPPVQMNLNKKSICSEDTIHLSSLANENKQSSADKTQIQNENVSPRKFGTLISNQNSVEPSIALSVKQASLQQSPPKAELSPTFKNTLEVQDNNPSTSVIFNKEENRVLSPSKSPKKKIQAPSPFRFDKLRSSKRIATIGSKSYTENSSQKENKDPNEAGPSDAEKSKAVILRQSNLNNFLNLDEMPESSRISTPHGIFDDIHSTPINGRKPQKIFEEPNVENAFGFDDCDFSEEISDIEQTSGPRIATEKDVAKSVKGKLFPNARVKSVRISENMAKQSLLKNVLKKTAAEPKTSEINNPEKIDEDKKNSNNEDRTNINNEDIKNSNNEDKKNSNNEDRKNSNNEDIKNSNNEDKKNLKDLENNNEPLDPKKVVLDAVSFSDTFDVLSENGEDLSSKIPDEIPLFVDLEPVHFTKPPRRSYNKRKKAVCFNTSRDDSQNEEDADYEKPKKKRKKESRLSKEEQKRLEDWVKSTNESFKEIEHFDLVVE